jgi:hypothetical protein
VSTTLLETIHHQIAGATAAGTSDRTAPVHDPVESLKSRGTVDVQLRDLALT